MMLTACGTDEIVEVRDNIESSTDENILMEDESYTINLCQYDENGEVLRELEFEYDSSLISWFACYNFQTCDDTVIFTEEQINNFKQNCG